MTDSPGRLNFLATRQWKKAAQSYCPTVLLRFTEERILATASEEHPVNSTAGRWVALWYLHGAVRDAHSRPQRRRVTIVIQRERWQLSSSTAERSTAPRWVSAPQSRWGR
jgi:hypothetical protein